MHMGLYAVETFLFCVKISPKIHLAPPLQKKDYF